MSKVVHKVNENEGHLHPLLKTYNLCGLDDRQGDRMSVRDNEVTCRKCLKKLSQEKETK